MMLKAMLGLFAMFSTSPALGSIGNPINTACPISGEPIDGATRVESNGVTIGFCCPGCDDMFNAWTVDRRATYIASSGAKKQDDRQVPTEREREASDDEVKGDPYPLTTCAVSGQPLGSMGDPIIMEIEGREIRLCCAACKPKLQNDTAAVLKKVDEKIIEDQSPFYPLAKCLVTNKPLFDGEKFIGVNVIFKNRLVRVKDEAAAERLRANPRRLLEELDKAVIRAQKDRYPLETCAVLENSKLGSMGDPVQRIVANRLVQFCCAGCLPKFEKDPMAYLGRINDSWKPILKEVKHLRLDASAGR